MWTRLADWFGLEPAPFEAKAFRWNASLPTGRSGPRSPARTDLVETDLSVVTSAWHTDADLGRPIEVVTDMSKSRKLGFLDYQATDDSFFDLFARLREARIIP